MRSRAVTQANVLLDPLLIFSARLGVAGAGLATSASQWLAAAAYLSLLLRHAPRLPPLALSPHTLSTSNLGPPRATSGHLGPPRATSGNLGGRRKLVRWATILRLPSRAALARIAAAGGAVQVRSLALNLAFLSITRREGCEISLRRRRETE